MILTAHVKPRAKQNKLEWVDKDTVKVWVTEPAEKGKANQAVIELLSKELKISKSLMEITRGHTTRIKQINIKK